MFARRFCDFLTDVLDKGGSRCVPEQVLKVQEEFQAGL